MYHTHNTYRHAPIRTHTVPWIDTCGSTEAFIFILDSFLIQKLLLHHSNGTYYVYHCKGLNKWNMHTHTADDSTVAKERKIRKWRRRRTKKHLEKERSRTKKNGLINVQSFTENIFSAELETDLFWKECNIRLCIQFVNSTKQKTERTNKKSNEIQILCTEIGKKQNNEKNTAQRKWWRINCIQSGII